MNRIRGTTAGTLPLLVVFPNPVHLNKGCGILHIRNLVSFYVMILGAKGGSQFSCW